MVQGTLPPKTDVVFKKVFGDHPHLLKSFLNAILPLPEQGLITHLEYLPAEHIPTIPILKRTIVDVKCVDQQGRIFIVEMRVLQHKHEAEKIFSHLKSGSYIKDEGGPFKIGFQEQILNRLKLLWSKAKVVSVKEKSVQTGR